MMTNFFICSDCGTAGLVSELGFFRPPNNDYQVVDKSIEKLLQKNKMVYAACPACRSPAIFFDHPNKVYADCVDPMVPVHVDDPHPMVPTEQQTTEHVADVLMNSKQLDMGDEPPPRPTRDAEKLALNFGGKTIGRQPALTKEVSAEDVEKAPDFSKAPPKKKVPPRKRKMGTRKCRKCKQEFQTKHSHVLLCKDCLEGYKS